MASHDSSTGDSTSIRVAIRCRPRSEREKAEAANQDTAILCSDVQVTLNVPNRDQKIFIYDHVFRETDTQANVFEAIGSKILENALNAYNACIFAYGQTGSGKSHSMVGDLNSDSEKGILPRSCERLFDMLETKERDDASFQATVIASYFEIYNEKLFDLLCGGRESSGELQVRMHPTLGAIVVNLTECPMKTFREAFELFDYGAKRRAVASTHMNATSSRSHAVFTLQIRTLKSAPAGTIDSQAKVHFVDLAGSEKQKKTGATGDRLKEGIGINLSLTTLGRVISDLTKPGSKAVPPFRDSKLTMLLKDALMGNSRTALLACISPAFSNLDETHSTLEFAARCKLVKTKAKKNEQSREDIIAKLKAEKEAIEAQMLRERGQSEDLCKQLQEQLKEAEEKHKVTEQAWDEKKVIEERLTQLECEQSDFTHVKEELVRTQELLKEKEVQLKERQARDGNEPLPQLGSSVLVSFKKMELRGTVRHTGPVEFTTGDVVGVELEGPSGMNDGKVNDVRYFNCKDKHGLFVRPEKLVSTRHHDTNAATSIIELQERLAEIEKQEQQQESFEARELRARLDEERKAQLEREQDLQGHIHELMKVQESWTLDRAQIDAKREEQHRQREAELAKLGMHFMGVDLEDMPSAPRLMNLHPDPALKGSLIYYLPLGDTTIGSDVAQCRVTLTGLNVSPIVCKVSNQSNTKLWVQPIDGGLVRVNGSIVGTGGQALQDCDRLAIGRAYIFQVQVPLTVQDAVVSNNAEDEFERAMGEIAACAQIDPQWENGIQKAMLLVKSDFGTEAANELLKQAKRASEAIATADFILQEMPEAWRDDVAKFELSVLFDAHGLPEVCIVARRHQETGSTRPAMSAGIWDVECFVNERLPMMHEALMLCPAGRTPSLRNWESRVWSELSIDDYKALAAALDAMEMKAERSCADSERVQSRKWYSQLKHNFKAVTHVLKESTSQALKDGQSEALHSGLSSGGGTFGRRSNRKGGNPAREFARAVSPAAIFRSVSTGRLERPTAPSPPQTSREQKAARWEWQFNTSPKRPP